MGLAIDLASFAAGLGLGLGWWAWQHWRLRSRLLGFLTTLSPENAGLSLSLVSLLRRGVVQMQARQRLLEAELATWQVALNAAPVAALRVDRDDGLVWCNQEARELFGLHQWQPSSGRLLLEVVRSYDLDDLIQRTRAKGQVCRKRWRFFPALLVAGARADPSATMGLPLAGVGLPLAEGEVVVFVENCAAIEAADRSRDRWANDLAHELRTPLTSIQLTVELLQRRLEPPARDWVDRVVPEVERLVTFVQDWLELGQMEHNPIHLVQRVPVQLPALLASVWRAIEPQAEHKDVTWYYEGPSELVVEADPSRLHRLFLNLLDNAVKYSPPGGRIDLRVGCKPELRRSPGAEESDDKSVIIEIVDTGDGFAPDDLPHVFDRLYRGDPSRSRTTDGSPTKGTGLGLAIARRIVLAHGGAIECGNDPHTGGARICITLPYPRPA